jgi:hypothetical protein
MNKQLNKTEGNARFRLIYGLLGEEKLGEALNELLKIIESDKNNEKAKILVKQLEKILEYQHRDVFASTNLNMDP